VSLAYFEFVKSSTLARYHDIGSRTLLMSYR